MPTETATIQSSSPTSGAGRWIDPATLMRIKSLELRAKIVVEGFQSGLNRSPYHGFSVEFTEYRQYTQGDDPRHLDWKLYARTDRDYIKRFEDETNLRCHMILDFSRSMGFGSLDYTKADYVRTLAATLSYFLVSQRDGVGLVTFDEAVEELIPARYRPGHLRRLMIALERQVAGTSTDIIRPLEQAAERINRRGMLMLASDLLASPDRLETSLAHLRARGHEVLVLHIVDPAEESLNFDKPSLFQDLETGREVYVDPIVARSAYQRRFESHAAGMATICGKLGIDYRRVSTANPLELALSQFLLSRMHKSKSGRQATTRGQIRSHS